MSDVWWTSSWVLVGRCVKSQDVPFIKVTCFGFWLNACDIKLQ